MTLLVLSCLFSCFRWCFWCCLCRIPVFSSAITTGGAAAFLTHCHLLILSKFGIILLLNTTIAIVLALVVLPACLAVCGECHRCCMHLMPRATWKCTCRVIAGHTSSVLPRWLFLGLMHGCTVCVLPVASDALAVQCSRCACRTCSAHWEAKKPDIGACRAEHLRLPHDGFCVSTLVAQLTTSCITFIYLAQVQHRRCGCHVPSYLLSSPQPWVPAVAYTCISRAPPTPH